MKSIILSVLKKTTTLTRKKNKRISFKANDEFIRFEVENESN